MMVVSPGIMMVARTITKKKSFKGKSILAKAYPAIAFMARIRVVDITATIVLLKNQGKSWDVEKALL